MRVTVVGSWRESKNEERKAYWGLRDGAAFGPACIEIGEHLARMGCSVVVCDDSPDSAEHYIVQGIVKALSGCDASQTAVHVVSCVGENKQPFEDLARKYEHLFRTEPDLCKDVPDARLMAVRMSDVVLAIAGNESTYESALISIINRKRLIPVGSFGGAAHRAMGKISQWRACGLHVPNTIPDNDDLAKLAGPWTPARLATVTRLLNIRSFLRLLLIYGRSGDWRSLKGYLHDRLKLPEPLVMSEIFGGNRALPEKFEQIAAPVHAAIAVLTPDDLGNPVLSAAGEPTETPEARSPRARQNVWLEIGWFWGALGRRRLLLLKRGGIEIPSDLQGIECVEYQHDPGFECAARIEDFINSLATTA